MDAIDRRIKAEIVGLGLSSHPLDTARHLDGLRFETLTGLVDGANQVYTSEHVPRPGLYVLFARGLQRAEGSDRDYVRIGREWRLNFALKSGGSMVDLPPFVLYVWDPSVPEPSIDMAALPHRRRPHIFAPHRRRRAQGG